MKAPPAIDLPALFRGALPDYPRAGHATIRTATEPQEILS